MFYSRYPSAHDQPACRKSAQPAPILTIIIELRIVMNKMNFNVFINAT